MAHKQGKEWKANALGKVLDQSNAFNIPERIEHGMEVLERLEQNGWTLIPMRDEKLAYPEEES